MPTKIEEPTLYIDIPAEKKQKIRKNKFATIPFKDEKKWRRTASILILLFAIIIVVYALAFYYKINDTTDFWLIIKPHFTLKLLAFIAVGFIAQMIDGSLGMGYGISCATCLMSLGLPPVMISAAIHTSEIFSSGISGYTHYRFGNVNKKLFKHLVIPGVLGAFLGAILLVYLGDKFGKYLMPIVAAYAIFLGIKILLKAFNKNNNKTKLQRVGWLGGIGGFMDSFGGGGWGPIVTSTLIAKGKSPRYTVGTVSLTEFFVTFVSAFTFFIAVGLQHLHIAIGLIIGSCIAAPLAAKFTGKIPKKTVMIGVGVLVIIWSIKMIVKSLI
jgi:uncharacterized protein